MSMQQAVSAVNRFGLGARPGDLAKAASDPRGWLLAQLKPATVAFRFPGMTGSGEYLDMHYSELRDRNDYRRAQKQGEAAQAPKSMRRKDSEIVAAAQLELLHRQRKALTTEAGFAERIVRFWSNHFAISADKHIVAPMAVPMEREAIRPHAFGRFADLLLAVETHPGMLLYLDNADSIGKGSDAGKSSAKRANAKGKPEAARGLNENLAREILELHTLGVNSGYAQADVQELARAITGWSVPSIRDAKANNLHAGKAFVFREDSHEPGSRRVLGKAYAEGGKSQGEAILRDLATHPATARHLASKLARHFVSDTPPAALVERMARAYLGADGDLGAMYRALVADEAAWSAEARKFKTPDDFVVSALRAWGMEGDADIKAGNNMMERLGQPVFRPRSPAGYDDAAASWSASDALFKRVQVAQTLSGRRPPGGEAPRQVGEAVLGPQLDAETASALAAAESPEQGAALLLASPAFQWRC